MYNNYVAVKKHVHKHRAKYAVAATLTTFAVIRIRSAVRWNTFLKDHDLFDTYYDLNRV